MYENGLSLPKSDLSKIVSDKSKQEYNIMLIVQVQNIVTDC